jgi:hypothetical protein
MPALNRRLADFNTAPPPADLQVEALARDKIGTYTLPFPCLYADGRWTNAKTGLAIAAEIVGWRKPNSPSR